MCDRDAGIRLPCRGENIFSRSYRAQHKNTPVTKLPTIRPAKNVKIINYPDSSAPEKPKGPCKFEVINQTKNTKRRFLYCSILCYAYCSYCQTLLFSSYTPSSYPASYDSAHASSRYLIIIGKNSVTAQAPSVKRHLQPRVESREPTN